MTVKSGLTKTNFPPMYKQRTHCEEHRVAKSRDLYKGGGGGYRGALQRFKVPKVPLFYPMKSERTPNPKIFFSLK